MPKLSKSDIIKKIIDINPDNPGTISQQYITKKNGKKLGPYALFQTSVNSSKVSIRVPQNEVDEIEDYINKMKNKSRVHEKKAGKLLSTYLDTISDISPGHIPPSNQKKND